MIVLGVGNDFRGDDAAGLIAARRLRAGLPQALVIESHGDLVQAMQVWSGVAEAVVIDAVSSGAEAGLIHRFEAQAEPLPATCFRESTHSFGIAQAIELARALDQLPRRLIVYGIEAASFEPWAPLSHPVAAAVEEVVKRVIAEVGDHA